MRLAMTAGDLLQLRHQPFARVQAPRGVDDQHVGTPCDRRIDRVECDGGGIGARIGTDELRSRALRPDTKLIDRAGAKGVTGRDDDPFAFAAQLRRELADERRLPAPFTPTTRMTDGGDAASLSEGSLLPVPSAS
jgi:hypothetical protein